MYDKGVKWFPVVPHGLVGREGDRDGGYVEREEREDGGEG